jgi:hypothetical protein
MGLQLPRRIPFAEWEKIGRDLAAIADASAWCLGDWLTYGENTYIDRYRSAIERTSLDYQTLRNYAWVARRFVISRRRPGLSFAHHAEVAARPDPEQDFWLRKAEEFSWSRNHLREELRASLNDREAPELDDDGDTGESGTGGGPSLDRKTHALRVSLTNTQLELCERAAQAQACTLEKWAVAQLERAARLSQA